jgi:hypothetical protein
MATTTAAPAPAEDQKEDEKPNETLEPQQPSSSVTTKEPSNDDGVVAVENPVEEEETTTTATIHKKVETESRVVAQTGGAPTTKKEEPEVVLLNEPLSPSPLVAEEDTVETDSTATERFEATTKSYEPPPGRGDEGTAVIGAEEEKDVATESKDPTAAAAANEDPMPFGNGTDTEKGVVTTEEEDDEAIAIIEQPTTERRVEEQAKKELSTVVGDGTDAILQPEKATTTTTTVNDEPIEKLNVFPSGWFLPSVPPATGTTERETTDESSPVVAVVDAITATVAIQETNDVVGLEDTITTPPITTKPIERELPPSSDAATATATGVMGAVEEPPTARYLEGLKIGKLRIVETSSVDLVNAKTMVPSKAKVVNMKSSTDQELEALRRQRRSLAAKNTTSKTITGGISPPLDDDDDDDALYLSQTKRNSDTRTNEPETTMAQHPHHLAPHSLDYNTATTKESQVDGGDATRVVEEEEAVRIATGMEDTPIGDKQEIEELTSAMGEAAPLDEPLAAGDDDAPQPAATGSLQVETATPAVAPAEDAVNDKAGTTGSSLEDGTRPVITKVAILKSSTDVNIKSLTTAPSITTTTTKEAPIEKELPPSSAAVAGVMVVKEPPAARYLEGRKIGTLRIVETSSVDLVNAKIFVPSKAKVVNIKSSTDQELNALRQKGLAQTKKKTILTMEKKNVKDKAAHDAASRDLEQRKANTSEYLFSGNGDISPLDALQLSQNKRKSEIRQKERDTQTLLYQRHHSQSSGGQECHATTSATSAAPNKDENRRNTMVR